MLFGMDSGTIGGVLVMDTFEKSAFIPDHYNYPSDNCDIGNLVSKE
jgi:hypothetical protein